MTTTDTTREIIPIIPSVPRYYSTTGDPGPDYRALCCFAATGFFLDDDTHVSNRKALRAASRYRRDATGNLVFEDQYFHWTHQPRTMSFDQALEEFTYLFERIVREGTAGRAVILPLSGGLDSRTLAAALRDHPGVKSYSYEFERGLPENQYGRAIAAASGFDFEGLTIGQGYLWDKLEAAAAMNECFSEFTHPRQLAVLDKVSASGNQFVLGHWGDVLFDDMGLSGSYTEEALAAEIRKKIIKTGGINLAERLWQAWGLDDTFGEYFSDRIARLLSAIRIDDPNARVRAFKSMYWAPRWTSTNLTFFAHYGTIFVPYYKDEMCRFICTVPEEYLSGRKLQIAYLKAKTPALAAIPWQKFTPCNLYNYEDYYSLTRLPYRAFRKLKNTLLSSNPIRRNWELQFLGAGNSHHLRQYLYDPAMVAFTGSEVIDHFAQEFQNAPLEAAHPISMLLTLSLFAKRNLH